MMKVCNTVKYGSVCAPYRDQGKSHDTLGSRHVPWYRAVQSGKGAESPSTPGTGPVPGSSLFLFFFSLFFQVFPEFSTYLSRTVVAHL